MFEITYDNREMLEAFKALGKAYKKGVYDFTYENRFVIYHAELRNQIDYIALDMTTGCASHVISKAPSNFYSMETYRQLIPHILYAVKYTGDNRYLNQFAKKPLDVIDGIFRIVLPDNGYTIREEQIALAKKMFIGLTGKQISICEAEVGTGKTLSYLVAGLVAKNYSGGTYHRNLPVTITTSSIELQKALVEREIPNLSRILMNYQIINEPLKAVLRKGKEHYFCRYRYEDFLRNIKKYPEKYGQLIESLEALGTKTSLIDLDKYRISGTVKSRICVKGSCAGCGMKAECAYSTYTHQMCNARDLDFQVTNHNMYLMAQKTRLPDQPTLLRDSDYVVVDEAHKFKEAAEDTFGERLNQKDIIRYVDAVKVLCSPKASKASYHKYLDALLIENAALFISLRQEHLSADTDEDRGNIITLTAYQTSKLNRMLALVDKIESMKVKRNFAIPVSGGNLKSAIKTINKVSKTTIWLDEDENGVLSLCCTPKDIHSILYNQVWNRNVSHVLTSGTISDGVDFKFFKAETGINQIPQRLLLESRTESPFDYEHHARLYIPQDMPLPDNDSEEYFQRVADRIHELIHATHGRTAILFTSYKALSKVYDLLKDRLEGYEIISMTRSNKTAISDFKKSKNGILFASGSMWEGVDCVGDCLSSVIIVRLPFPMRSARMEEKRERCKDVDTFIERFCAPDMLIKLRQGAGRLIRSETDTGVVSILDPRANSKRYAPKVEQALRKFPKVDSVSEVGSFVRSVKDARYFEGQPEETF